MKINLDKELQSVVKFCNHKFVTEYKGIRLKCQCYLNAGHTGDHVCGYCHDYPLELHPYEGEKDDNS